MLHPHIAHLAAKSQQQYHHYQQPQQDQPFFFHDSHHHHHHFANHHTMSYDTPLEVAPQHHPHHHHQQHPRSVSMAIPAPAGAPPSPALTLAGSSSPPANGFESSAAVSACVGPAPLATSPPAAAAAAAAVAIPAMPTTSPGPLVPPTYVGYVQELQDALYVFEGTQTGQLPRTVRRLTAPEKTRAVFHGAVYVFLEKESGIKRWTDKLHWSASRISGQFLVYREIEKIADDPAALLTPPQSPPSARAADLPANAVVSAQAPTCAIARKQGFTLKGHGMVKRTLSLVYRGVTHHLVSYYDEQRLDELSRPSADPALTALQLCSEIQPLLKKSQPVAVQAAAAAAAAAAACRNAGGAGAAPPSAPVAAAPVQRDHTGMLLDVGTLEMSPDEEVSLAGDECISAPVSRAPSPRPQNPPQPRKRPPRGSRNANQHPHHGHHGHHPYHHHSHSHSTGRRPLVHGLPTPPSSSLGSIPSDPPVSAAAAAPPPPPHTSLFAPSPVAAPGCGLTGPTPDLPAPVPLARQHHPLPHPHQRQSSIRSWTAFGHSAADAAARHAAAAAAAASMGEWSAPSATGHTNAGPAPDSPDYFFSASTAQDWEQAMAASAGMASPVMSSRAGSPSTTGVPGSEWWSPAASPAASIASWDEAGYSGHMGNVPAEAANDVNNSWWWGGNAADKARLEDALGPSSLWSGVPATETLMPPTGLGQMPVSEPMILDSGAGTVYAPQPVVSSPMSPVPVGLDMVAVNPHNPVFPIIPHAVHAPHGVQQQSPHHPHHHHHRLECSTSPVGPPPFEWTAAHPAPPTSMPPTSSSATSPVAALPPHANQWAESFPLHPASPDISSPIDDPLFVADEDGMMLMGMGIGMAASPPLMSIEDIEVESPLMRDLATGPEPFDVAVFGAAPPVNRHAHDGPGGPVFEAGGGGDFCVAGDLFSWDQLVAQAPAAGSAGDGAAATAGRFDVDAWLVDVPVPAATATAAAAKAQP
ncbi:Global transcription regulator sge1 [Blastocladiella emersonii ATCC 22665]|nr:Global transcription regulator sge1 [Blastocladiella emersonii ATCC 22665]